MKFTLASVNHLFDSGNGSSVVREITEDASISEAAGRIGIVTPDSGQLLYPHNRCFLPTLIIDSETNSESQLPYIANGKGNIKQFHCGGFVVLNHELEHIGYYPETVVKSNSSLLMPPPSIFDTTKKIEKLYITDSPEQYIDLLCCGLHNIVAPAYGQLNHQHLRQISQLPVREIHWVTTRETFQHEQIISRLAIFAECLGSYKTLKFTILKNNEDNTPFASMVIDSELAAISAINEKAMSFGKIMKIASNSIGQLDGNARSYALRAIAQCVRTSLSSGSFIYTSTEGERDLLETCIALIKKGNITPIKLTSLVSNVSSSTLESIITGPTFSEPDVSKSLAILADANADNTLAKIKIQGVLNGTLDNLNEDFAISDENLSIATMFLEKLINLEPHILSSEISAPQLLQ